MKILRVVACDDSPEVRDFIRKCMLTLGHELVGLGESGHDAVNLCEEFRPELALLDLSMGDKSGEIAAKEIIKNKTAEKVLLMTSMSQAREYLEKEGLDCIAKPVHRVQLGKKIDSLFEV